MRGPRRQARSGRTRGRLPGWVFAAGWLMVLLTSLFVVTWRQTRGLQLEQELREMATERALIETEGVELSRRIEELRSRSRVVRVARERLGMHLPEPHEIVFLPVGTRDSITAVPGSRR